jgi:Flp pilus assembly protein TadG
MKKRSWNQKAERGQSFVELALSITFLLTLLVVVIDLGWALYTMIALRDAAQEAATFGSICPRDSVGNFNEAGIIDRLRKSASAPLNMDDINPADVEVCVVNPADSSTCGAPIELGNSLRITVTVQHQIITPFVGNFIGRQTYPLTVTVLDTLLRESCFQ